MAQWNNPALPAGVPVTSIVARADSVNMHLRVLNSALIQCAVQCRAIRNLTPHCTYEKGTSVSEEQFEELNISRNQFHGE